jgi:nitrate reductase gamma subunit
VARTVINKADIFILIAVAIAFALGVYLFFSGERDQGLFVATWVPAILCFGIYFKLMRRDR